MATMTSWAIALVLHIRRISTTLVTCYLKYFAKSFLGILSKNTLYFKIFRQLCNYEVL